MKSRREETYIADHVGVDLCRECRKVELALLVRREGSVLGRVVGALLISDGRLLVEGGGIGWLALDGGHVRLG